MNEKIVNTLNEICENNEEYTMVYTPKHDRISLVYISNLSVEILYIETINNTEYKFKSNYDEFKDTNIEYIISSIYYTLIKIKMESLFEDLNIDNANDFNNIITIINNISFFMLSPVNQKQNLIQKYLYYVYGIN